MLKVFIVDDEVYIRQGLAKLIDWEKYGFKVVGDARNGVEALKYLENNSVDLIITDIQMPFMDGIELITKLREKNCYTDVIFLTAFSEFEYALQGIKLSIVEYLLKPIEEEKLVEILKKIIKARKKDEKSDFESLLDKSGGYKNTIIVKAQRYVCEHVEEDINLNMIANYLNISRSYFCTIYKQETGESFGEFIVKQKMKRAKKLLVEENMKVYEVCHRLGYSDKNNFSKLFKKNVGVTPLEYKKKGE